jgi:ubiquinone/menaquinone biosynthesis C-methylase UbiE
MRRSLMMLVLMACSSSPPPSPASPPATHAHEHGPLVHRFEHADEWAPKFDDPARDEWQKPKEVVAAMEIAPGMTVADIGAGTGYFEPHLSRAVGTTGSVLALDVEPDMVRYMTERAAREKLANVKPAVVPMDDPKLPTSGVDRVLIVDTWHHVPERKAYAKKLAAGLKPGAKVFIVDFTLEAKHGPPPHHRLPPEAVVSELADAGLTAKVLTTTLPEQYIVSGERR